MVEAMTLPRLHRTRTKRSGPRRTCLACGQPLCGRRRRYCADYCRQLLLAALNRRTGLLTALSTRYATFYFTAGAVVMDVLPYDSRQIYSYLMPRGPGQKPMDAFGEMCNRLGQLWWQERNRTKKRYLASRRVLEQAYKSSLPQEAVVPRTRKTPSVNRSALLTLQLAPSRLTDANLLDEIKRAYRRQAKQHHPDLGGSAEVFRRIQDAYEKMLQWAQQPTFIRRSGFVDKWFYEGYANRWTAPIAAWRLQAG